MAEEAAELFTLARDARSLKALCDSAVDALAESHEHAREHAIEHANTEVERVCSLATSLHERGLQLSTSAPEHPPLPTSASSRSVSHALDAMSLAFARRYADQPLGAHLNTTLGCRGPKTLEQQPSYLWSRSVDWLKHDLETACALSVHIHKGRHSLSVYKEGVFSAQLTLSPTLEISLSPASHAHSAMEARACEALAMHSHANATTVEAAFRTIMFLHRLSGHAASSHPVPSFPSGAPVPSALVEEQPKLQQL
jgi:hypothetical protein